MLLSPAGLTLGALVSAVALAVPLVHFAQATIDSLQPAVFAFVAGIPLAVALPCVWLKSAAARGGRAGSRLGAALVVFLALLLVFPAAMFALDRALATEPAFHETVSIVSHEQDAGVSPVRIWVRTRHSADGVLALQLSADEYRGVARRGKLQLTFQRGRFGILTVLGYALPERDRAQARSARPFRGNTRYHSASR